MAEIPDLSVYESLRSRRLALEGENFNIPLAKILALDMEAAGYMTNAAMLRNKIRHYEEELAALPDDEPTPFEYIFKGDI
jgi:hypothetical protein